MKLVAVNQLHYDGKTNKPGDLFEAPELHAKLLMQSGSARIADDAKLQTAALKSEELPAPAEPEVPRKTRQYKRRDLRAEE